LNICKVETLALHPYLGLTNQPPYSLLNSFDFVRTLLPIGQCCYVWK